MECNLENRTCVDKPDTCVINNICYRKGDINPFAKSEMCDPDKNRNAWTVDQRLSIVLLQAFDRCHPGEDLSPTQKNAEHYKVQNSDDSPPGSFGGSAYFDGKGDHYVKVPNEGGPLDVKFSLTLSFYIKPTKLQNTDLFAFIKPKGKEKISLKFWKLY